MREEREEGWERWEVGKEIGRGREGKDGRREEAGEAVFLNVTLSHCGNIV